MTPPTWKPADRSWRRLLAAVTSPTVAGGVVFVGALLIAVLYVVTQPHEVVREADPGDSIDELLGTDASAEGELSGVIVHVAGEVQQPGVVELEDGARVEHAIEAAGGLSEEASLTGVNLARPVIDGEQILIPHIDAAAEPPTPDGANADGRVNLNTADSAALESLPRIGPALAARIIEWRETNGGFTQIEDLMQVSGIGQKVFAGLRDLVVAP